MSSFADGFSSPRHNRLGAPGDLSRGNGQGQKANESDAGNGAGHTDAGGMADTAAGGETEAEADQSDRHAVGDDPFEIAFAPSRAERSVGPAAAAPPVERAGSITQWSLRGTDLAEDVLAAEAAGLRGIGLNLLKVDDFGREKAIELMRSSDLEVTSLDWLSNFTGYNQYSWQEACDDAIRTIRLAERLRCPVVTVLTGPRGGQLHKRAETLVVEAMQYLADVAADSGVTLALMPMQAGCGEEWTYLHTIPHAVRLLERIGSPHVGLSFHAFHLFNQPGLPTEIQRAAKWIRHVRLSDWDRSCRHENDQRFPGRGQLPLAAMMQWLQQAGYTGRYEVDVWSPRVWRQDLDRTLADTKEFCQSSCPSPLEPVAAPAVAASTFEAVLSSVRS